MHRATPKRSGPSPARGGAGAALLVVLAVLALAALGIEWWPRPEAAGRDVPALLVGFVFAAFGLACITLGALWASARARESLHEMRQREDVFANANRAWLWQTDAEHRLVALRPPRSGSDAAWAQRPADRPLLWEHFGAPAGSPDAAAVEARMRAGTAFEALSVGRPAGGRWMLSGAPHRDLRGSFLGYYGLGWPMDEADALQHDSATLAALWNELPCPLVDVVRRADGRWHVARLNAAAQRLPGDLGAADPAAAARDWPEITAAWPTALREAALRLDLGRPAEAAGWRLRWIEVGAAPAAETRRLLLLEPAAADEAPPPSEGDSFVYSVSHDLRAPIRVIEGFAKILKEDYGRLLDRIGNDHLGRVLGAAGRMHQMIDALLELSRLTAQPLRRQRVDLSQLAHFVLDDLGREAPERRREFDIEPEIVVQGDPTLLRVALENLLGNAWKYTARCEVTEISFRRARPGGRAAICVADNGAGFDMRFADRLFGVFQRLHSASDFPGTGVGLASVRRIVAHHGGEVWAEAEVGRGARFYFTLGAAAPAESSRG